MKGETDKAKEEVKQEIFCENKSLLGHMAPVCHKTFSDTTESRLNSFLFLLSAVVKPEYANQETKAREK